MDTFTVQDNTYQNGRFGFYNYSQVESEFKGFTHKLLANNRYAYPVVAVDPEGEALTYRLLEAPVGMTIDETTGAIFFDTDENNLGNFQVVVEVEDNIGQTDQQAYDLVVTNDVPIIISKPQTVAEVDTPYLFGVAAFDPNVGDTLNYSLVAGPAGMSVNAASGELNWLPSDSHLGAHNVTVEVSDPAGNFDRLSYSLNVVVPEPNDLPVFSSLPVLEATVGRPYRYTLEAFDPDGGDVQYLLGGYVPQGLEMFDGQTVTWTPTIDQVREHHVTFMAADAQGGIEEQSVTIQVKDLLENTPPSIQSDPTTQVGIDESYSYQVQATDDDGNELQYFLDESPVNMSIDKTTGLIQWTSNIDQGETARISVVVTDGQGGIDTQTFGLKVMPLQINSAPIITSRAIALASVDQVYQYQVIATDADNDAITFELAASTDGITFNESGLLEWTPQVDQIGAHEIVIVVADEFGYRVRQSFTLTVSETNSAPQLTSSVPTTLYAESEWRQQFTASDADGDTLLWSLDGAVGDMTITSEGLLSWTPLSAQIDETIAFTVTVSDTRGLSSTGNISIVIAEDVSNTGNPGDPTIPVENENQSPQLAGVSAPYAYIYLPWEFQVYATDADNDALTWSLINGQPGMSISDSGYFSWTPPESWANTAVSFAIEVSDGKGGVDATYLTVPINHRDNEAPAVQSEPVLYAKLAEDYLYTILASDIENDAITYELDSAPQGTQLTADGQLSWNVMSTGSYDFAVWVNDAQNQTLHSWTVLVVEGDGTVFITSEPLKRAKIEAQYQYQLSVINMGDQPLTYSLVTAPAGMNISDSGYITYQATTEALGLSPIQIRVETDQGERAEQTFNLQITAPGPYNRRLCR